MSTSNVLEIIGILTGGGGAGAVIAKLTRLVVALENLAESHKAVLATVADHEKRLNRGGL